MTRRILLSGGFVLSFFLAPYFVHAQGTFKQVWSGQFTNDCTFLHFASDDGNSILGTTKSDACLLNGNDGNLKWTGNFLDMAGIKNTEIQFYMADAGIYFVVDRKSGNDMMIAMDATTGKKIWSNGDYKKVHLSGLRYLPELKKILLITENSLVLINPKTGEKYWSTDRFNGAMADVHYSVENDELIILNYKTSWGALFSGFKNQLMSINQTSGDVNWTADYFGVIHNKPTSGGLVFDMQIAGDKIFLMVNGLQVIDRKTGKELWKTDYDLYDTKGLGGSTYEYGGVAYPLVHDDAVYLIYNKINSKKVLLQKLDVNTGEMFWESKIDVGNAVVPTLIVENNLITLQIGGYVNIQGSDTEGNYFNKYRWDGPFGVMVYNTSDGKVVWSNTDLKKRVSNIVQEGNTVYAADEKKLYAFDLASGKINYAQELKTGESGAAMQIDFSKNNIMVLGEDGVSNFQKADGSLSWTYKGKDVLYSSDWIGENFAVRTEKFVAVLNPADGKEIGRYTYGKKAWFRFTTDGKYLIHMSKKEVIKYQIS